MTPIDPKTLNIGVLSARKKRMHEEIQAFIDSGCECAELWKDETICDSRNYVLYSDELIKMGLSIKYRIRVIRSKIVIVGSK